MAFAPGHIALNVTDLARSTAFYRTVFAFDVDAVRRAETVLKGLGVDFAYDGIVPHGEGAASGGVFFTDPDGVRLEIYAPNGAEGAPAPTPGAPTCGFF